MNGANDVVVATIESALRECDAHLRRLRSGEAALRVLLPLSVGDFSRLDDDIVMRLDQFVYRFTKLQDSIARRLLPALYAFLEADTEPRAFLDMLHRLEQLGVITDVTEWQRLRNLRNNLAHDYPESLDQTVGTLNELLDTWRSLETMYNRAASIYRSRNPSAR